MALAPIEDSDPTEQMRSLISLLWALDGSNFPLVGKLRFWSDSEDAQWFEFSLYPHAKNCTLCWILATVTPVISGHSKINKTNILMTNETFQQCGFDTSVGSDKPVYTRSLIRAFASRLNILCVLSYWPNTYFEFLSLKGGWASLSESTLVKIIHVHCW